MLACQNWKSLLAFSVRFPANVVTLHLVFISYWDTKGDITVYAQRNFLAVLRSKKLWVLPVSMRTCIALPLIEIDTVMVLKSWMTLIKCIDTLGMIDPSTSISNPWVVIVRSSTWSTRSASTSSTSLGSSGSSTFKQNNYLFFLHTCPILYFSSQLKHTPLLLLSSISTWFNNLGGLYVGIEFST